MATDWKAAQEKSVRAARWAVTMTKVRIRQVMSRTRWQLVTFNGKAGAESVGVVDLLAVRKDHGKPIPGTKRGDVLLVILVQIKGGSAAMPTTEDGKRLKAVATRLHAKHILLAAWKKGSRARFFSYQPKAKVKAEEWVELTDISELKAVFH